VETSKDPDMPREPLTLVAQHSKFLQLDLAQPWPTTEEQRHALVAIMRRITKLVVVEK